MIESTDDKKDKTPDKLKKKPEKHTPSEKEKPKEEAKIANRVRVSGVILDGNLDIIRALTGIKGLGIRVTRALAKAMGFKKGTKLSSLNEKDIETLEIAITTLDQKLPGWMLNRRNDYLTGKNTHLTGPELDITNRSDIDRHKKIRSYRGIRHSLGQPVRGQRTRSSFRTGGTVGVVRKKEAPAATGDAGKKGK
ncbi:MAG: 30S ribosomal protein S13 [Candidatus Altiarchaeota archaeon]|nr:30S ribosomal protein S13 [Candidatus Altiarchaeota archaeon]